MHSSTAALGVVGAHDPSAHLRDEVCVAIASGLQAGRYVLLALLLANVVGIANGYACVCEHSAEYAGRVLPEDLASRVDVPEALVPLAVVRSAERVDGGALATLRRLPSDRQNTDPHLAIEKRLDALPTGIGKLGSAATGAQVDTPLGSHEEASTIRAIHLAQLRCDLSAHTESRGVDTIRIGASAQQA